MSLILAGLGWAGQAAFAWRTLDQWLASEKAGRTVVPAGFWTWSIVGAVLTLLYALGREDPVFVMGAVVTGAIFLRNAWMGDGDAATATPRGRPALWPLVAGFGVYGALVAARLARDGTLDDLPTAWIAVGFAGQVAWSGRFIVQWWASEHRGRSVLPGAFFSLGLVGSALLLAYAVRRADAVNVAAYALNPLPYGRNWLLHSRAARRGREEAVAPPEPDRA